MRSDVLEFELGGRGGPPTGPVGLFPQVLNLANAAIITANATCGQDKSEMYCKLSEASSGRETQCSVCDGRSPDPTRRHPIERVTDGSGHWWQSPSLAAGDRMHYVTIDIDLRQVYQVAYVVVKSAISPRPGNWIMERSLDGRHYSPWQYYAVSDRECRERYGVPATPGRPRYTHDTEVICTSYFSRLTPFEGGEVHTSLVNGRPGSSGPSEALRQFTEARFIRLRLQKIRGLEGELEGRSRRRDPTVARRYFYSIKDIRIGGRCACNGHAEHCSVESGQQKCKCQHNTCGPQCDRCCPLYNQVPWRSGNFSAASACEQCQCHGHSTQCRYDSQVHRDSLSLNTRREYIGGGVCVNCQHHTEGINCDRCKAGYYRPQGVPPHAEEPCQPCGCGGPGVTGECVRDDTQFNLGIFPGACICREGFEGPRCDRCAPGYRNYPACESCPCHRAGTINDACEGDCQCKANVAGVRCDVCADGKFSLDEHNPMGCTECFCNGVTGICEAAKLPVYTVVEHGNWMVSDLLKRRVIAAAQEGTDAKVAHDDMSQFNAYYFVAPQHYLGSRLTSYGQRLSVRVTWVKLRGDTSGWALHGPDVILEGAGFRIAHGLGSHKGRNNARISIPLHEHGWYHFPKDIGDIPHGLDSSEYQLREVSRAEMMQLLNSLETLMIRARFHTVQVESILHGVALEYGKEGAVTTTLVTGAVERCVCPIGYEGLSCESCSQGYRRVNNTVVGGTCELCNCHGHSLSCDPYTGACGECLHHTTGPNCDRCLPGYYGDPMSGREDACQPCSCPLPLGVNHFTPSCSNEGITLGGRENFICDCPVGYEGLQCERCADGFFGSPLTPGNYCQPCDCSGNVSPVERGVCDRVTGQCLKCLGNTAGWRCEQCKENHFGDPERGQCIPCGCVQPGSISDSCDPASGQCQCRPLYVGRQCHRCQDGHGGVEQGCPPCHCSNRGSYSQMCDPVTGLCPCKPGVGGRTCSNCLEDHYGNLSDGCSECQCDPVGSVGTSCASTNGQCNCKPNVVGRDCSRCAPGHYGLTSGRGCTPCDCDGRGSDGGRCDEATGRCLCAPGVGGERCDRCLPGFWGFSEQGCQPCEPCGVAGRSCDLNSGKCICPLNTEGDRCERCRPGSWDYSSTRGCKLCQCSSRGALDLQCDFRTGRCICRPGFQGPRCEQCSHGYYGAPDCQACRCHPDGTQAQACDARQGRCQCDAMGQCPCKPNTTGRQCDRCAQGTFGLSADSPLGCTPCYCFRRTNKCQQAPYTWSQVSVPQPRVLSVTYGVSSYGSGAADPSPVATVIVRPWDTRQICYINLALPGERHLSTDRSESRLNVTNTLHVIPLSPAHIVLGTAQPFPAPLYWTLPKEFMRDKVRSYNGYLRFRAESSGGTRVFPDSILQTYPLVSLQGNWQLVLEHFPRGIEPDGTYSVRLHEDVWRLKGSSAPVTREMMMIALQNIQHILIRATHSEDVVAATLSDVTLDVATEGTLVSSRRALGVEQCFCPENYEGLSCQNPGEGFFRWYKDNYIQSTIIIDLVGESRPCNCNGRSDECDQESGVCLNCRANTAGSNCELCASGYYGDPNRGPCRACACPSLTQNFAETCEADRVAGYICHCKEGYTGDKCDRCAFGFYGRPAEPGGRCIPCDCDPNGSLHGGCDTHGRCTCKPNIQGRDCSQCAPRHIIIDTGCKSCEDGCVDVLLDDVEELIREIEAVNTTHFIPPPWPALRKVEEARDLLRSQLNHYRSSRENLNNLLLYSDLEFSAKDLLRKARQLEEDARRNRQPATDTRTEAQDLLGLLNRANSEIGDAISLLTNYAIGETASISVVAALEEAKDLLKQIQNRDGFDALKQEAEMELEKAKALLERMLAMQVDRGYLNEVSGHYGTMQTNIREMLDIIRAADTKVERAGIINSSIRTRRERVRTVMGDIEDLFTTARDTNFNSSDLLREAQRNLDRTRSNYGRLEQELPRLQNYSRHLAEHEGRLYRLNNEYRSTYADPAHEHALGLMAKAIQLEKLFNTTRVGALGPLNAAQAYQRIVDALTNAEQAARNASLAANKAFQVAYPGDPSNSLIRQAKNSRQSSQELGSKGTGLLTQVEGLENDLQRQQNLLAGASDTLRHTSAKLTDVNMALDTQLDSGLNRAIQSALFRAEETHTNLDNTLSYVNIMHANLTRFLEFASDVSRFDTSLLNDIREKISAAESSTMTGVHLTSTLHTKVDRIEADSLDLSARIKALKQKIQQTRQHASSIRVSVTPDEDEVCVRRYSPALQSSTTNSLVLSYAINTHHKDALILYLGNNNASEFVSVEMKNRRIQVTWNVGGGPQTLRHPTMLLTNTPTVSNDKRWYHVEFRRVGNIGELQVRPANPEGLPLLDPNSEPVTAASPAGYTNINLRRGNSGVWIGGAPPEAMDHLSTSQFAGCLHYATVDGANLGLWNFTSNTGCTACNEGVELISRQEDENAFGFNGKGYFRSLPQRSRRPKNHYSVTLFFKTLDEHALLFLTTHEDKDQLFSLTMEEGLVVLRVHFDQHTKLVMRSRKRLNNIGDMTTISATVLNTAQGGLRMAQLQVGDQAKQGTVKGGPDLDLGSQPFYFGGVDPQFNKRRWGDEVVLRSMLGCMAGLSVMDDGMNPFTDGQFYGIENACSEKALNEVGFHGGEGFIELASQELRRDSNFGFTFQTMEANAMLMLSTFVGQPLLGGATEHPPDYYSVSLVEGHLDLRLYAGNVQHGLMSPAKLNDGKIHSFFVLKQNRKVTLLVDDQSVNGTRLSRGRTVVQGPPRGGLYFGGVPPTLDIVSMVGSSTPYKGCIRNVIVNNQVISFTRPKGFKAVYIGRCSDLPAHAIRGMESDVKEAESCQPPTQHTLEYGALKFGDQTDSHALLPIAKTTFADYFNVTFEFRTYYPNGLFLYAEQEARGSSGHHRHRRLGKASIAVHLQNGRVVVAMQGRRRSDPSVLVSKIPGLNTGHWKKVLLQKHRKTLRLTVGDSEPEVAAAPRRGVKTTQAFIGGLSRQLTQSNETQPLDPLRGCLRNFHLNGEKLDIPQHTRRDHMVGVGQCFAHVQPGSYFPGDAYAIYGDEFSVGPVLEFALEFRTWELNGVLLSVADEAAGTSLALEIVNGAVMLNVNVGSGHTFGARVGFRNRYSLCDNSWHSIRAYFVKDSLTLRVDNEPEAYGFNGAINGNRVWAEAPLYIGGLPEYAPQGSLKERENFQGCIRNIVIDSARTDWTDMYRLHNVLLNACPVH